MKKIFLVGLMAWIFLDGNYINTKQITFVEKGMLGNSIIYFACGGGSGQWIATKHTQEDLMKIILKAERKSNGSITKFKENKKN